MQFYPCIGQAAISYPTIISMLVKFVTFDSHFSTADYLGAAARKRI
ncbi:hypothetical protein [Jeotgalibacillus soli]|uniref:Uncharacterized protein n=1 Tax=Jeotgalibacillus soli TaxID=889306 RepID=A0A0C2VKL3_9BACL|nr:hypothetical protein [Jeotgalibacillus soli]KIL44498.1 hypothetical protein KP78_34620 [Jeotgalibacillus soli]